MRRSTPSFKQWFASGFRGTAMGLLALGALASCAPADPEPESAGTQPLTKLITAEQYGNSLTYIFGPGIDTQVQFAPVARNEGLLANSLATAGVSVGQVQTIQSVASSVARQVMDVENRNHLVACRPESIDSPDEACAAQFVSKIGRLLFRRALTDAEVATFVEQAGVAALDLDGKELDGEKLDGFYAGLEVVLEGLLIHPEVLFIVEGTEQDPNNAEQLRLDAYSLASRLSFFLWNASPDDELLAAAESGDLQSPGGVERSVDRMLESPRLVEGMRAFFDDMLVFNDFKTLAKDATIYPEFTSVTSQDAREQTLRTIIDHTLNKGKDYRDLFTSRDTFMSPALAIVYGVPAQPGWAPYTFEEGSPRAGLLTQVSFLALTSHPGRSSVTLRGMALRERLLCQTVPEPPPGIDFSVVSNPDAHYPTQRQRVAAHLETPSCAGCHRITDPIGLSLEQFDGAGGYRLTENGATIDVSGGLDGFEFDGAIGLGEALRLNPELPRCLVQRVYSYATGGPPEIEARAALNYFNDEFAAQGYQLRKLLRTIALSKAFSLIQKSPSEEERLLATNSSR
ncbi:MAG: DUF1592 domain-containing protein [Gammaproteobacteria bacterium]